MRKASEIVRRLNKRILSKIETELDVLQENNPELSVEITGIKSRLRTGILDEIGDCVRILKTLEQIV